MSPIPFNGHQAAVSHLYAHLRLVVTVCAQVPIWCLYVDSTKERPCRNLVVGKSITQPIPQKEPLGLGWASPLELLPFLSKRRPASTLCGRSSNRAPLQTLVFGVA